MNLPYMIYKRVRAGLGLTFGFILMYGAVTGNLGIPLLIIAFGFFLVHLFGDVYNDYTDYHEDLRNERKEKLTVSGTVSPAGMRNISFLLAAFGLLILSFMSPVLLAAGLVYAAILFAYSNRVLRMKKHHFKYYLPGSILIWFTIVISLNSYFSIGFDYLIIFIALFFSSQYFYIVCQKDSTDRKDDTNMFIENGWNKSWIICSFAALSTIIFMAGITVSLLMIIPLGINFLIKIVNLKKIREMSITRPFRSKIVALEFATPYIYLISRIVA